MYLNIEDTSFIFKIRNYNPKYDNKNWDSFWCNVTLIVKNRFFTYSKIWDEMLLSSEIDIIKEKLWKLLKEEITGVEMLDFIEPDLSMILYPSSNTIKESDKIFVKDDAPYNFSLDFEINLTDKVGAYIDQKYSFRLCREEIEELYKYLNSPEILNEIDESDYDYIKDEYTNNDYENNDICVPLDNAEEIFDDVIITRGKDYFNNNKIKSLEKINDIYNAQVTGNIIDPYVVQIKIDEDNNITHLSCNCPCYFFCKHEYATILEIRNKI